ncbi:MAG: tRNA preQ1(34) S-adenosylmethionine ribosyltransferase-isomerase QueA [Gemmatimonadota bacterium]|nr:tRNA preQ1(34) S-adenosylmethionine ribosyltransferase-isomerase QueA [Gemmatimonadota bacterium]
MTTDAVGETAAYEYDLPPELIASRPLARRDASRLLAIDRRTGDLSDRAFSDLPELVRPGDALVLNDSRVFPARLRGEKPTGARAEILLVRPVGGFGHEDPVEWEAIVRPGGKLKPGRVVRVASGFDVEIVRSCDDGTRIVRLSGDAPAWDLVERHGHVPLPPYIERPDDADDRNRYQTVYADPVGSIAAPTAGLHFTAPLLERLADRGVRVVRLTLHVGVGTFRPVTADRVAEHRLHAEVYRFPREAADALNRTRESGGRIWAVGTTSCRVLETVVDGEGRFAPRAGSTELFIHPPYRFRGIDALLTNFHLPRSSLLMLVAAFAGRERILAAYRHAVGERYRFYSYGDAMVIS